MSRSRVATRALCSAAGLTGILLSGSLGVAANAGAAQNPYTATASSAVLRLTMADQKVVPLLQNGEIDITSPQAQVASDSYGGGRAVASMVYPGDDIAGLPVLIGALLPPGAPALNLPAYPVTVVADQGTPSPPAQSSGAYALSATVGTGDAMATAQGGLPANIAPSLISATASAEPTASGGVVATAQSSFTAFGFGNLLSLGSITTSATAERTADGTLKRSSHMAITAASILGLPLEISDGQLVVPILGPVLPVNKAIQTLPILKPLKAKGISLSFQQAQNTPNGIIAPGIKISWIQQVPAIDLPALNIPTVIPGQPAIGPIPPSTFVMTATLGYGEADAVLTPLPPFTSGGPPVVIPQPSGNGVAGASTGAIAPSLGSVSTTGTSSSSTSTSTSTVPGSGQPSGSSPGSRVVAYRLTPHLDLSGLYLMFALGSLIAVGARLLARSQGVRTRWKS